MSSLLLEWAIAERARRAVEDAEAHSSNNLAMNAKVRALRRRSMRLSRVQCREWLAEAERVVGAMEGIAAK